MPIYYNDKLIGYVSAGELKSTDSKFKKVFSNITNNYGMDGKSIEIAYSKLVNIDNSKIDTVKNFLQLVEEYITNILGLLIEAHDLDISVKPLTKKGEVLNKAREYISKNLPCKITIRGISHYCGCSDSYLQHVFKQSIGVTITQYINSLRIEKAKYLLARTDLPVTEIALKVGFKDSNYFSTSFFVACGIYPTSYRKKYNGI